MNFYNCTVRHAGNLLHTIPKSNVSDRELRILRRMHGDDAVVDVVKLGERPDPVDMSEFYMELAATYGQDRVEKTFGIVLDDFEQWLENRRDRAAGLTDQITMARAAGLAEIPVPAGAAPDTPGDDEHEPEPAPAPAATPARGRKSASFE